MAGGGDGAVQIVIPGINKRPSTFAKEAFIVIFHKKPDTHERKRARYSLPIVIRSEIRHASILTRTCSADFNQITNVLERHPSQ